MRKVTSIIFLLLFSGLFATTRAQVSAVMQARVKIISGAGLTEIQEHPINLTDASSADIQTDFKTGSFSLVAAPGTDVNVQISEASDIYNEEGDALTFDTFTVEESSTPSGNHHFTVNGRLKAGKQRLSGQYRGAITATVEYL